MVPYHMIHQQSSSASRGEQESIPSIIGNRTGVVAMGNMIFLAVFPERNNVLLCMTDLSHGTYLSSSISWGFTAISVTAIPTIGVTRSGPSIDCGALPAMSRKALSPEHPSGCCSVQQRKLDWGCVTYENTHAGKLLGRRRQSDLIEAQPYPLAFTALEDS